VIVSHQINQTHTLCGFSKSRSTCWL